MKKTLFLTLLISQLMFACQSKTADKSSEIDAAFTTYSIDIKAQSIAFSDQIESIEMLGFEETSESLIRPGAMFFPYEKGYIVVDENNGSVFFFDKIGSFERQFNHKGQGPEEYRTMQNTNYRDGIIETYVSQNQKMMQYGLGGNFIQSLDMPYRPANVIFFDKGYLLGMGNKVLMDSINYNLVFADDQMVAYKKSLRFEKSNAVPLAEGTNDFRIDGDRALFNPLFSDSVYQVKDDKVSPFIHFDFGEEWLWQDDFIHQSMDKSMDAMADAGKVWLYTWVLGPDRIEITYVTGFGQSSTGFIDRKSKKFYNYDYDWLNRKGLPFMPISFIEDKLLVIFSPDVLGDFISAVGGENVKTIGTLSEVEVLQSENPVLVWVKFKK